MQEKDIEILRKVQSGDIQAFGEIVEKYKDRGFSLTLRILKNHHEAEDSLQEAFLKLYRSVSEKRFEGKSSFSTYFYSIVYNTAVDHYRKFTSKRFNITSIDVTDSNYREGDELLKCFDETEIDGRLYIEDLNLNTEKNVLSAEIQKIVNKYIGALPEHYSVILTMFYVNELSQNEISEILSLPLGTIKNRIFRAKEKLKEVLLRKYPTEELLEYI
ncbi:MAG: sigma-70 family RNA polymerase sigma factor [Ignavibacteriae bacterium]|nr:sigma-70 family RNA polymerase sigma factor [Ignavibacteriota bacterium]